MKPEGITQADAVLSDLEQRFMDLDDAEKTAFYYKALYLADYRDALIEQLGEKEGKAEFKRRRQEHLGLGDAVASKMLTIAEYIPHYEIPDGVHASYLYVVARAVKKGLVSAEDALYEASIVPMRDFMVTYGFTKEPKPGKAQKISAVADAAREFIEHHYDIAEAHEAGRLLIAAVEEMENEDG